MKIKKLDPGYRIKSGTGPAGVTTYSGFTFVIPGLYYAPPEMTDQPAFPMIVTFHFSRSIARYPISVR